MTWSPLHVHLPAHSRRQSERCDDQQRLPPSRPSPTPRRDLGFNSDGTSFHTSWKSVTLDARDQGADKSTLVSVMLNNYLEGRSHDP